MNAGEKLAWTQLVVSVLAAMVAILLIPWLGSGAVGAFGLVGFSGFGVLFLRPCGKHVVVDERDTNISRTATAIGMGTAWMALLGALIVVTVWSGHAQTDSVPTEWLNWLIAIDSAIVWGMTGLAAVVMYRRQRHAA